MNEGADAPSLTMDEICVEIGQLRLENIALRRVVSQLRAELLAAQASQDPA